MEESRTENRLHCGGTCSTGSYVRFSLSQLRLLCTYQCQAQGGGRGGGGAGNPRGFDCDLCPQGGDFDHLIFQLQREEEKKTILLTRGWGF